MNPSSGVPCFEAEEILCVQAVISSTETYAIQAALTLMLVFYNKKTNEMKLHVSLFKQDL